LIQAWAESFDWQSIDTVLLDMDGTLLDLNFDTFFWLHHLPKRYSQQHQLEEQQATADVHQRLNDKRGTLDWYCTDFWSRELNVDIVALKQEIQHLIGERPQALDFLRALGQINKQRILVTNAHRDSVEVKFAVTGIEPLLDQVITSHDYGYAKEDQRFWQQLQHSIGFDPKRTLFIDDSKPVLNSARDYGIAHLLAIESPDSQQPPAPDHGYPAIRQFAQILGLDNG
jgi:putative hydrolase of the HAD superfamily